MVVSNDMRSMIVTPEELTMVLNIMYPNLTPTKQYKDLISRDGEKIASKIISLINQPSELLIAIKNSFNQLTSGIDFENIVIKYKEENNEN